MAENVKELDGKAFRALVAEGGKVVCDFWAAWCGPCRMLAPVVDGIAKEMEGRASFVKVNVDEEGEIALEYEIMSIPCVIVFEGGQVKARHVGYVPEETLRAFLDQNI